jgi:DNA replication protein DnaC
LRTSTGAPAARWTASTLADGDLLRSALNLLITDATGSGKTWLACALAHQAARSGFSVLYVRAARLLLELLDDRIGTRSTLITSQLPVKAWHTYLNDPTLADATLDRIVHSRHKIELRGTRSMRDGDATAST